MEDLPQRLPADHVYWIGDPVIDVLLKSGEPQALAAVAATRMRRLMAATGLDAYPELVAAVEAALAGEAQQPADDRPVGTLLRQIARDKTDAEAHLDNLRDRVPPPIPVTELHLQVRRGDAAALLRFFLDGRPGAHVNALLAAGMDDRQIADLSGRVTTGFIDLLRRGYCTQVSVESARSLLAIPDPSV